MMPLLLRSAALLIALLALIDPAMTVTRRVKPIVSLVATDQQGRAALDRIADAMQSEFTVVRAPFAAANATVMAGNSIPSHAPVHGRTFALIPGHAAINIAQVTAPRRSVLNARVAISVSIETAKPGRVELTLHEGSTVVERVVRTMAGSQTTVVPLSFVPTRAGVMPMRIEARLDESLAIADLAVTVDDKRYAILSFDPRPSWMSTFVRRALERDARFAVTSRVTTSRALAVSAGAAPERLADAGDLARFDAIVVGAPELITAADVDALERYMRQRAGSVMLLLDRRAPGNYERLAGVGEWGSRSAQSKLQGGVRAAIVVWPARLPGGAETIAPDENKRPVVWRTALGPGQLVVSGALDAWRFRDSAESQFDRFYRDLVAEAAAAVPDPIEIDLPETVVPAGEPVNVRVTVLDPRSITAGVSARLANGDPVRLWPETPGVLRGVIYGFDRAGAAELIVTAGNTVTRQTIVVRDTVKRAAPTDSVRLRAWAAAHGGAAFRMDNLAALQRTLARAVPAQRRRELWHPMRSAWWIVPFVLLLGAEWWWRRRRGLA